jgi:hypothetical protein
MITDIIQNAANLQLKHRHNPLCPYLTLAIVNNFTSFDQITSFPSKMTRFSTRKILDHMELNYVDNIKLWKLIESGLDFKEILEYY